MAHLKDNILKRSTSILLLMLLSALFGGSPAGAEETDPSPATIYGQVMINKTPMLNGIVLLFDNAQGPPPSKDKYWRIPDIISGTDQEGKFSVNVPEGTYFLQVAQKTPDGEIGPPQDKEYFYFHADHKGEPNPIKVGPGARRDLGVLKAFLFTPDMVQRDKGITAVEGVVTNEEGAPVENALVFAYLTPNVPGRPTFVSERTTKDGKYLLRLREGSYYLRVRSVYGGGAPQEGEMLSVTKEFEPVKVTVKKGQRLKGIAVKGKHFARQGSGTESMGRRPEKRWKNVGELQAEDQSAAQGPAK